MTAPQEAGGAGPDTWLDMSRYPDTDPDAVLSPDQHELLSSSLAVDDTALPDAVWEHMLAVVTGDAAPDDTDDTDDTDTADDPDAAVDDVTAVDDEHAWSEELARALGLSDGHDAGAHDAGAHDLGGHDDPADHHGHDGLDGGGWV